MLKMVFHLRQRWKIIVSLMMGSVLILPLSWQVFNPSVLVVRIYFHEGASVQKFSSWKEPWAVNYDLGYLVVGVTPDEFTFLQKEGYTVVIDEELTRELNRPRAMTSTQTS